MKVSKMVKQAMANAKLENPHTASDVRKAWLGAVDSFELARKRQWKIKADKEDANETTVTAD